MEDLSREELEEVLQRIFGIIEEVLVESRRLEIEAGKITNAFSIPIGSISVENANALQAMIEASSLLSLNRTLKESFQKLLRERFPEQYGNASLIFRKESKS